MAIPPYVPLWNKTHYSFLEGASHPEELVDQAHAYGLPVLAITDRNGLYGIVRAHVRARAYGMRLLIGAQLTLEHSDAHVVMLARNRTGYAQLCQLLSAGHLGADKKGEASFTLAQVQRAAGDVLLLCDAPALLPGLQAAFGDQLYGMCAAHLRPGDAGRMQAMLHACARLGITPVAAQEVLYHSRTRRPLQDVLTCIRHRTQLAQAKALLRENAEHALRDPPTMQKLWRDHAPLLQATCEVAERCTFSLTQLRYRYPGSRDPQHSLRTLTWEGAHKRFGPQLSQVVQAQLERELELIAELDYGGYFLTMHEVVDFCRRQGILCQGRGSAANSLVCFCLGITAIDPVRMDLLFERFISRERAEPPDIDLDIEHQRREEVIQWVYSHYGRRYAAMVANVVRFRLRSAIRQVGKAMGVAQVAIEALAKVAHSSASLLDATLLQSAGLQRQVLSIDLFVQRVQDILDFPRHLSVHPGGFLLGHEPVDSLVPIENATMPGRTVIQWDKQDIEDLGLFKVDLLGLGALTQIRMCFALLRAHAQLELRMDSIPGDDAATFAMLCRADTVGVFQVESRAQMAMLPRLQPRQFYDLVVEVAIVRPGPIQGDMVHPYLRRRLGMEQPDYPHPSFARILGKTYGVPIFQEQVMKIAMQTAGYTPGQADQLRRDMAAWRSAGRIETHHDLLVERMVAQGVPAEFAERIFAQIRGFGEYGFPESHAASFAFMAYVTAWLKCHHPVAFCCALLNAQPMGFYSPATVVQDAKRHGVAVLPLDINASAWDCTLQTHHGHWAVRMGLRYIKGFGSTEAQLLAEAQQRDASPFVSLADLAHRTQLPAKSLQLLAESGACQGLGLQRRAALWASRGLQASRHDSLALPAAPAQTQFAPLADNEAVLWDYRTTFHSTRGHPMQSLRSQLHQAGMPTARVLTAAPHHSQQRYVGMVICRQRPQTASGVAFFTLEDETGMVNVVLWAQVFEQFRVLAKTCTLLGIAGHIQRDLQVQGGPVHLIARRLFAPRAALPTGRSTSRDFH